MVTRKTFLSFAAVFMLLATPSSFAGVKVQTGCWDQVAKAALGAFQKQFSQDKSVLSAQNDVQVSIASLQFYSSAGGGMQVIDTYKVNIFVDATDAASGAFSSTQYNGKVDVMTWSDSFDFETNSPKDCNASTYLAKPFSKNL